MTDKDRPLLTFQNVSAAYPGGEEVLKDISLEIHKGEVVGLASLDAGGGKTTLTRVGAGLMPPTAGRLLFDGVDVYRMGYGADQKFRARFSVIFEGGALLENRTIWDNVALPLRYHGDCSGRELKATVERLLAQSGYNEKLHAFPWQVSERSRRLAAFARALSRNPEFVIVDRFFEGLEMPDWRRLFELVMELNQNEGVTWLLVSELDPAIFHVAERVAILEKGRILDFGFRKQLYRNPRIEAAFEAAEVRLRHQDSERILIVDSSEELEVFGSKSSGDALSTATPISGLPDDLGETLNIDGAMPSVAPGSQIRMDDLIDPLDRAAPPSRDDHDDPQRTISLDIPSPARPKGDNDAEKTMTLDIPSPAAKGLRDDSQEES